MAATCGRRSGIQVQAFGRSNQHKQFGRRFVLVCRCTRLEYLHRSGCVNGSDPLTLAITQVLPVLKVLAFGSLASALIFVYLLRLFARRLQGFTGDCLGTTQQVCEIAFYLGCTLALGSGH